jgi:hypothetical protein
MRIYNSDNVTGWRLFKLWWVFSFFRLMWSLFVSFWYLVALGVLFYLWVHQLEVFIFCVRVYKWWHTGVWPTDWPPPG